MLSSDSNCPTIATASETKTFVKSDTTLKLSNNTEKFKENVDNI